LTLGLLVATSWLLSEPLRTQPAAWALIAVTVLVLLRTRASPLWLVALGAVVGALGYV
jgi:chromate transporter